MKAQNKVKFLILLNSKQNSEALNEVNLEYSQLTDEDIENMYNILQDSSDYWEAKEAIREGEVHTEIETEYSRHYESRSVASQLPDGSWVGWTYWYGGGKHGEPQAIDWIEDAYDLDCVEEEKMVTIRTFTKKE